MLTMTINDRGTAAALGQIYDRTTQPGAMLKVIGRRGANELKTHFRRHDQQGNKLGARRSHLWRQIADSVNSPTIASNTGVRISITNPVFAQKVFGGPIRAKNAAALTIPVTREAYGRTAAVFEQETGIQLFLLRKKGGGISNLLAGFPTAKHFKIYYVLVKQVDQAKDPNALPPQKDFGAAILDEATKFIQRDIITNAKKGGAPI